MMTFTHTHEDLRGNTVSTVQMVVYEDSTISDVLQEFRRFLLAVSFSPETVDRHIEPE